MKFNANFLIRDREELQGLEEHLKLLGQHSKVDGDPEGSLDIFCTYKHRVIISPLNGKLPRLMHSSEPNNSGKNLAISLEHGPDLSYYSVFLKKDGYCFNFDIYYCPLENLTQFLQAKKQGTRK